MIKVNYQEKVSNIITDWVNDDWTENIAFESPTGSGKTNIISSVIKKLTIDDRIQNNRTIFIVIAPSKADLYRQFSKRLLELSDYIEIKEILSYSRLKSDVKKVDISVSTDWKIDNPSSNVVYAFGSASFTKNTYFVKYGVFEQYIKDAINIGYNRIVFIDDEAHIAKTNLYKIKKEVIKYAKKRNVITKSIFLSATFLHENHKVKVKEGISFSLKNTWNLKNLSEAFEFERFSSISTSTSENILKNKFINVNNKTVENSLIIKSQEKREINEDGLDYLEYVDIALEKYYQQERIIKKSEKFSFNPMMLIQYSSINSKKNLTEEEEQIKRLIEIITKNGDYYFIDNFSDHKKEWEKLSIFSASNHPSYSNNNSELREKIKNLHNSISFVFFKDSLTEGFDAPRANFLLRLKNVISDSKTIQTIGRVKRNPLLSILNKLNYDEYKIKNTLKENEKIWNKYFIFDVNDSKKLVEEFDSLEEYDDSEEKYELVKVKKDFRKKLKLNNYTFDIESDIDYSVLDNIFEKFSFLESEINDQIFVKNNNYSSVYYKINNKLDLIYFLNEYWKFSYSEIIINWCIKNNEWIMLSNIAINLFSKNRNIDYLERYIVSEWVKVSNINSRKDIYIDDVIYDTSLRNQKLTDSIFDKWVYLENETVIDKLESKEKLLMPEEYFLKFIATSGLIDKINKITRHYIYSKSGKSEVKIDYINVIKNSSYVDFFIEDVNNEINYIETKGWNKDQEKDFGKTDALINGYIEASKTFDSNITLWLLQIDTKSNRIKINKIKNGTIKMVEWNKNSKNIIKLLGDLKDDK